MSDKTDELSVQLNEAFERLEGETASAEKPDAQQSGRQKSRSEAEASNLGKIELVLTSTAA